MNTCDNSVINQSQNTFSFRVFMITLLLIYGSLWGLNSTVSKFAADGGIHAFSMAFWQSLIAAVSIGLVGYCSGERLKLTKGFILVCLVCGTIGLAIPNVIFYTAVSHVSVGIISIALSLTPLVTLMMSFIIGIEKKSLKKTIGILLGGISVLLIIIPEASFSGSNEFIWLLIILLPPFGYSVMNIFLGRFMPTCKTPLLLVSGVFTVVAVSSSIFMLFVPNSFNMLTFPLDDGETATILLGVFIVIAHSLYIYSIKKAGVIFASLGAYIVAISGVLWGVLILGEKHTTWIWISLIIMIMSLYLVQPNRQPYIESK